MVNLPNELINIIFSYCQRPPSYNLIEYIIRECYMLDYDPIWCESWRGNYSFEYSFNEWYFLYRKQMKYIYKLKKNKYYHTPHILIIGCDRLKVDIF